MEVAHVDVAQRTTSTGRRPTSGWRYLTTPGWLRVIWMTPSSSGSASGSSCFIRWLAGWHPIGTGRPITVVALLTAAPVGFLAGIGGFDYWLRLRDRPADAARRTTRATARTSWQDYFRVNTDHKVIGDPVRRHDDLLLLRSAACSRCSSAPSSRGRAMQFFDTQTFNGLFSVHAALMIFLFIIPAFAGLGELRDPADDRRAGHGVPAPERALVLAAADRRDHDARRASSSPGGAVRGRLDGLRAALASTSRSGTSSSTWASSGPARRSIMTALNFLVTIITMRAPGMTFWRMPLLVWANFTTSLLVVIATPFIAGSQFFVHVRPGHAHALLRPGGGGYVLGYQHIFWFYSHPAVYIMMLPGFGIASRGDLGHGAEADLRLPADGALADGDPRARLLGLGAPHVRRRAWRRGCACR